MEITAWKSPPEQLKVRSIVANMQRDLYSNRIDENVSSSTSGKFMRFEKWLLENGAKFPNLELKV